MSRWLVGRGALHEAVARRLASSGRVAVVGDLDDAGLAGASLVISAHDHARHERDAAIQRRLRAAGVTLLPARLDGDLGIVGPLVEPGQPGCLVCSERARRLVVLGDHGLDLDEVPSARPVAAGPVTGVLAEVVAAALDDPRLLPPGAIYVLRALDLAGRIHRFHPVVGCPECRTLPADSAERARVRLQPSAQPEPERFRVRPGGLSARALRDVAYDWRYGPVKQVFRDEKSPLALVAARVVPIGGSVRESGYGRSTSYEVSEVIALYEALERIATATPTGKRTVVHGTELELREHAVDVPSLGLHDPRWYGHEHFELAPYGADVPTDWVWGWRPVSERPVLVPEHVAYYDIDFRGREPGARYLYESSSGCALGSTVEEAILYGLFELIERDAFLLAWYGKLPVPRLEVDDSEVLALSRDQLDALGYDLLLFDISNDLAVPAVASLALRRDDRGPKAFFAAGAHCDPRRAVHNAVAEVATNVVLYPRREVRDPADHDVARLRGLLQAPEHVVSLEDHIALYTLPEAVERYSWLLHDGPPRTLAEAFGDWRSRWCRPDLTDTLRAVLGALAERGLDPIVVDETPAGLGRAGLHAVKTILPGALPMTFGGVHERVRNLPRLCEVPAALGYWPRPRALDDIPIDVHPFP